MTGVPRRCRPFVVISRRGEIQPRCNDYDADRGAIRKRASERTHSRNDAATRQPIIRFRETHSVVFSRFQWTGDMDLSLSVIPTSIHVIRDINGIKDM